MLAFAVPTWAAASPTLGMCAGFVALILGASLLVRGAVWMALVLGVSQITVSRSWPSARRCPSCS